MALFRPSALRGLCSDRFISVKRSIICFKYPSEQTFKKNRAAFSLSFSPYSSLNNKNSPENGGKDDDDSISTEIVFTQGPLRWLKKKFNMWRLKKYFDHDFDKEEFLQGAKHAFCTISALVCEARLGELEGLAHPIVIHTIRRAVYNGINRIPIEPKAIIAAEIGAINFGAVDDKDVVDVEVTFACDFADRISSQRVSRNVRMYLVRPPTAVVYIFRKERTLSDLKGSWFVMGIKDNILGIETEYSPA